MYMLLEYNYVYDDVQCTNQKYKIYVKAIVIQIKADSI
jgi:hypothetical protein